MNDRYPGYDVLAKRNTPSWNEPTRRVIDQRLAVPREPRYFTAEEFATLGAIADRITPQPEHRAPIPVAALIDAKLMSGREEGYRAPDMPREGEAWRRGLAALDAEARNRHGVAFRELQPTTQDGLLTAMSSGDLKHDAWQGMSSATFFKQRLLIDIVSAYWSHPTAWSEMGWGGPASPRGYVRMGYDARDPWEPAEARAGHEEEARGRNRHVG